ncbi:MAG: hypothetical protein QOK37_4183 [Thermoanaerobaculia bacterium]|jgi:hypothetical protein|nr:hypothetical protein [Thermoanaerobaculia bacterium]
MKTLSIAILMLISSAAYAQSNSDTAPTGTTIRPVLQATVDDATASRLDVEIGTVRLTTHSGRYTVAYLPFLAPLPGTAFRSSMEIPNALTLTGTTIPQRPRSHSFTRLERR